MKIFYGYEVLNFGEIMIRDVFRPEMCVKSITILNIFKLHYHQEVPEL